MPTPTELSVSGLNSDASTYNPSLSRALVANTLGLAAIHNEKVGTPDIPTLSGGGVTWVQIATSTVGGIRTTLFRAMGASPSGTSLTVDYGGNVQSNCSWTIVEWADVDTGGTDGSAAVVQSNVNSDAASGTTLAVTLSAFADAVNNVAYGVFGSASNVNCTPEGGYTGFTQGGVSEAAHRAQWQTGEDTSVSATYAVSVANRVGIAIEIAASGGGGASGIFAADALFLNRMQQERRTVLWG